MSDFEYPYSTPVIQPNLVTLPYPGAPFQIRPGVAPRLMTAVEEVYRISKAPWELVLLASLTPLSIALQGTIDVEKLGGQPGPVSLMSLILAGSGERKSTVDNLFLRSIREFQREQMKLFPASKTSWELQTELWATARVYKKKAHQRAVKAGNCTAATMADLLAHEHEKPVRPRACKLLYEDGTVEALLHNMFLESPFAALISSEGGGILDGRIIPAVAKLNALWSGDSITVDRKSADSFELVDARLTIGLMVQPSLLDRFLEGRGQEARGSGLLARYLVMRPESTQGKRFADGLPVATNALEDYSDRIKEILAAPALHEESLRKHVVTFTPEAKGLLLAISNGIEQQINAGGRFEGRGDHASKLTDNITRVTALMHCFEYGHEAPIDTPILEAAISLCFVCSDHFAQIFSVEPEVVLDSRELERWLVFVNVSGRRYFRKNNILQFGPNKLRSKERLTAALGYLEFHRRIGLFKRGRVMIVDSLPYILHCEFKLSYDIDQ